MSTVERFLDKITIGDGCWEWQAHRRDGYGMFRWNGQMRMAHRFAYELMVGPIPDGYHVDHLCRNPGCVRFDHLEAVPASVNSQRKAGWVARKWRCPSGHPYSPDNVALDRGHPYCMECKRASCRRYYAKKRALGVDRLGQQSPTHCKRGHEFTPENTYVKPDGRRQCRACVSMHRSTYRAKRKGGEA